MYILFYDNNSYNNNTEHFFVKYHRELIVCIIVLFAIILIYVTFSYGNNIFNSSQTKTTHKYQSLIF